MSTPFMLGRFRQHDPRSKNFPAPADNAIVKTIWHRHGPALDQGQLGSCTGNATAQTLNHSPFRKTLTQLLTEDDAVRIYSKGTELDGFEGTYPPDDTGSSGLAVAKAAQMFGYIDSYTHAFGLDHVLSAAMSGPLIVGTRWHQDMFQPDSNNQVRPTGDVVGGHEYCLDGVNPDTRMLRFLNSWGESWGHAGHFYISFDDFEALLIEGGDAVLFQVAGA